MNHRNNAAMTQVRELARQYTHEQLEHCLARAVAQGTNSCIQEGTIEHRVNVLAKASYVRTLIANGNTLAEALRQLGHRMRALQASPLPQERKVPPHRGTSNSHPLRGRVGEGGYTPPATKGWGGVI